MQKKEFIEVKKRTKEEVDDQDAVFDFNDFRSGADRLGWLVTYSAITVSDPETGAELSGKERLGEIESFEKRTKLIFETFWGSPAFSDFTVIGSAGVEYYFIQQDGHKFKALLKYVTHHIPLVYLQ